MINKKHSILFIFTLITIIAVSCNVSADYWGNQNFQTYYYTTLSIPQNNGACQEMVFHKNGTIDKVCPAMRRSSDCDTTFWIADYPLNISAQPYQSSEKQITYNDDEYFYNNNDCIDMPDFSVTEGQHLYFCGYIASGGCTGQMYIYGGNGMSELEMEYSNYYPRSQFRTYDARWKYGNSMENTWNKTAYWSGYKYTDGDGNRFPERSSSSSATYKIAFGQEKGMEVYFPYDDIDLKNVSMIAKATTQNEYWVISLYNTTDLNNDLLFNCSGKWEDTISNDTQYHIINCDISPNIELKRGYYRIGMGCYEDAGLTTICDGTTDYLSAPSLRAYSTTTNPYDFEIGLMNGGRKYDMYNSLVETNSLGFTFFRFGLDWNFALEQCSDGFDNDYDGTYDFPNDADCSSPTDTNEGNDYNTIYNETCVYDWDCNEDNNCHGEYEALINRDSDLFCSCNENQCSNFDTKYSVNDLVTGYETGLILHPYILRQFESGNFAGFTNTIWDFNNSVTRLGYFYVEYDKDQMTKVANYPSLPIHILNPICDYNFSLSGMYRRDFIDYLEINDTTYVWLVQNQYGIQSNTIRYGFVKISEGCNVEWEIYNHSTTQPTFAFVDNLLLATINNTQVETINIDNGNYYIPVDIDFVTSDISGYNDNFVAVEWDVCANSKNITLYDTFGDISWSTTMANFNTDRIYYDETGVYLRWYDCSVGTQADRYLTKFNATNGDLIYTSDLSYYSIQLVYNYGTFPFDTIDNLNSLYLQTTGSDGQGNTYYIIINKINGKPVFSFRIDGDTYQQEHHLLKLKENIDYSDWYGMILNNEQKDIYMAYSTNFMKLGSFIDGDTILSEQTNETFIPECTDGIDNDGDGFIDFPDEPSCASDLDNTEAPFDSVACNDGIDNDADGFIDYPLDPACGSENDLSEYPNNAPTSQPDNVCLIEEFCLIKEQFPYSDAITNHGWTGNTTGLIVYNNGISNMLEFALYPTFPTNFNGILGLSNPNTYNEIRLDFDLYNIPIMNGNITYYLTLKDNNDRNVIILKYVFRTILGVNGFQIYAYDGSNYDLMTTDYFEDDEQLHRATITFDQTEKTFDYEYSQGGQYTDLGTFTWTDILAFKINDISFQAYENTYANNIFRTYIDNINMIGDDAELTTSCDTYNVPYFLKESFNGYLRNCGWTTSSDYFAQSKLTLTTATSSFYAYKPITDGAVYPNINYLSMAYTVNLDEIESQGEVSVSLRDNLGFTFLTLSHKEDTNKIYYNDNGINTLAYTGLTTDTDYIITAVVNIKADTFDLWVDDVKVATALKFTNRMYNLNEIGFFQILANEAGFSIDNVLIYASDSEGKTLLPNQDIPQQIIKTSYMCDLFTKEDKACSSDDDCTTGVCTYAGTCSRFDYTYCDENGKERGQMCVFSAVTKCGLQTTATYIFDNFLLFLVLIILIIGGLYLVMFLRKG